MLPSGHAHKAPLHRQRHGHGPEADGEHRFCFLSVSVQEPPFKFIQVNGFNGGCIPKVLLQDRFLEVEADQVPGILFAPGCIYALFHTGTAPIKWEYQTELRVKTFLSLPEDQGLFITEKGDACIQQHGIYVGCLLEAQPPPALPDRPVRRVQP